MDIVKKRLSIFCKYGFYLIYNKNNVKSSNVVNIVHNFIAEFIH